MGKWSASNLGLWFIEYNNTAYLITNINHSLSDKIAAMVCVIPS